MKKELIDGEHGIYSENGNLLASPTTSETEAEASADLEPSVSFKLNKAAKDGCWAWVICAAAFCDLFIVLGIHYSFGVLYSALLDKFAKTKSATGMYITNTNIRQQTIRQFV